jgi:hypothetical protein
MSGKCKTLFINKINNKLEPAGRQAGYKPQAVYLITFLGGRNFLLSRRRSLIPKVNVLIT